MRKIKFRAWDKKTKKMRQVDSISFGIISIDDEGYPVVNLLGRDCINDTDILLHREGNQYILMQSTNLFDKNGKEIYEGDILQGEEFKRPSLVEWSDVYCSMDLKLIGTTLSCIMDKSCGSRSEVIGNIYENPELLEVG